MTLNPSLISQPDLASIQSELERTHSEFLTLFKTLVPSDWNHRDKTSAWSIKELVAHLTWSIEQLPKEIKAARQGKGMYNFPDWLANLLNIIVSRSYAWRNSPTRLEQRYRKSMETVLALLGEIQPDEWSKGANFYGHGYYTILDLYHTPAEHLVEHQTTINQLLLGPVIKPDNRFMLENYLTFHKALRNDIGALYGRMAESRKVTTNTTQNLKKLEQWFNLYCNLITSHHTGEDKVDFVVYGRRDPYFKIQLHLLETDHHNIEDLIDQIKAGFEKVIESTTAENYHQLTKLVQAFGVAINEHLDREEAAVIKSVRTHFTEAEQKKMEKQQLKREGLKKLSMSAPWIVLNLNSQDRAELFRKAPITLRILYELSWKKKFLRIMPTFED